MHGIIKPREIFSWESVKCTIFAVKIVETVHVEHKSFQPSSLLILHPVIKESIILQKGIYTY